MKEEDDFKQTEAMVLERLERASLALLLADRRRVKSYIYENLLEGNAMGARFNLGSFEYGGRIGPVIVLSTRSGNHGAKNRVLEPAPGESGVSAAWRVAKQEGFADRLAVHRGDGELSFLVDRSGELVEVCLDCREHAGGTSGSCGKSYCANFEKDILRRIVL